MSPLKDFFEPHPRLHATAERMGARLLLVLMAIHTTLSFVGLAVMQARMAPGLSIFDRLDALMVIAAIAIVLVAFALVRVGRYRTGAIVYVLITAIFPLVAPFFAFPHGEIGILATAVIPVLIASLVLETFWVAVMTVALVAVAGVELSMAKLSPTEADTGSAILIAVGATGALLIVLRWHYAELERRRIAELTMRDETLHDFFQTSPVGICITDETGVLVDWNQALCRLTGIERGEAIGRPVWNVMFRLLPRESRTEERRSRAEQTMRRMLESGRSDDQPARESEIETADGTVRWMLLAPFVVNTALGHRIGTVLVDVTDKKLAAALAEAGERKYRDLFETSNDGIFVADSQGKLMEVNDSACAQLGYSRQELLSKSIAEISALEGPSLDRRLAKVMTRGRSVYETAHRRKDGTVCPVELSVSPVDFGGHPAFLGIARDITERKKSEDQQRHLERQLQQAVKMESIGILAGGVAHDFNNLLTVISGNVSVANRSVDPNSNVGTCLREIGSAVASATSLTRQLLAFSRKQVIEPRPTNLSDLVSNMHKMLGRLIGEDIDLRICAASDLDLVLVDPGLIEQAIINLVVNARDAMPTGGKLVIETVNVDLDGAYEHDHPPLKAGRHVMLAVSDTGTGMSEEVKAHLFEPFFTTKPKGHGTGLGLATTYGAIKQSGGDIQTYSEVGRGTTLRIYLPRTLQPLRVSESRPAGAPTGTETILVVEDQELVRRVAVRILKGLGYNVLDAVSGEDAVRVAAAEPGLIALLLTDVIMPDMNGRELATRLTSLRPELRVLFTSGYTENVIGQHGVLDPGIDFIAKPYRADELAWKVRTVIDRPA
jgi:two-component system, cell cycle sensor histidine kinase and response regulator CckA